MSGWAKNDKFCPRSTPRAESSTSWRGAHPGCTEPGGGLEEVTWWGGPDRSDEGFGLVLCLRENDLCRTSLGIIPCPERIGPVEGSTTAGCGF